jgi:subtilisin family serine protease
MGITGQGVVVGGQDTGYEWYHPELKDSYRGWDGHTVDHNRNWHDAWGNSPTAFDDRNHGTHTMGTAVGNTVGMAPDAQWIGCRSMRNGIGNPSAYVECMEFFFAPYPLNGDPFRDGDPSLAPNVVNNSWGCPPEEGCVGPEPIHTAVEVIRAAGIMMVTSAGNDGPACNSIWTPANEDAVFSVGASNPQEQIVYFSSRGPVQGNLSKPDVVAPGVEVVSSIPYGAYGLADGTSMASPHVAGLVALMWSANPSLIGDIDMTETIITQSAEPKELTTLCPSETGNTCACGQDQPGQVPNNVYGYGLIDAQMAVKAALELED